MTKLLKQFRDDENGAAMVEYSILIGIIAVASIGFIIGIGGWVTGRFTGLCTAMDNSGIGSCASGSGS
jgi:pilus assembly protein Flp/PilA